MDTPTTTQPDRLPPPDRITQRADQRAAVRARHSQALLKLMDEREDLRGVHALADLVADSLRWSA